MAEIEESRREVSGKYLTYKGRPLVREGITICYGDKSEKYILIMYIVSTRKEENAEVPDKVMVQVIDSNDPTKIIKQDEKGSLYDAFVSGLRWLELALRQK